MVYGIPYIVFSGEISRSRSLTVLFWSDDPELRVVTSFSEWMQLRHSCRLGLGLVVSHNTASNALQCRADLVSVG